MTDVPAATPVTAPVDGLIVATAGVAEVQAPPVTVELSVEEPLEQIAVVPERVPAEGAAVTVTVEVAETFAHPPVPVIV
jgi:preprotein translocase subunit Sec61beta